MNIIINQTLKDTYYLDHDIKNHNTVAVTYYEIYKNVYEDNSIKFELRKCVNFFVIPIVNYQVNKDFLHNFERGNKTILSKKLFDSLNMCVRHLYLNYEHLLFNTDTIDNFGSLNYIFNDEYIQNKLLWNINNLIKYDLIDTYIFKQDHNRFIKPIEQILNNTVKGFRGFLITNKEKSIKVKINMDNNMLRYVK